MCIIFQRNADGTFDAEKGEYNDSVSSHKFVLNIKYAAEIRFGAGVGLFESPLDGLIEGVHMPLFSSFSGKDLSEVHQKGLYIGECVSCSIFNILCPPLLYYYVCYRPRNATTKWSFDL